MPDFNDVFEQIKLSTFPRTEKQKVLYITSDMTLKQAVTFLNEHNILSAPVRRKDASEDAPWKEAFIGILDMLRVTVLMLDALGLTNSGSLEGIKEEEEGDDENVVYKLPDLPSAFANKTVEELSKVEDAWFPFLPLEESSTFMDAVALLGTYRMKRIPIIDADGKVVNIITQSSMLHELGNQMDQLVDVTGQTIDDLSMGEKKNVYSVRGDEPVKNAFKLIMQKEISAVPVVGQDGAIIGNISARHAYQVVMASNKLRLLNKTCRRFIQGLTMGAAGPVDIRNTVITCQKTDTLGFVIKKMDAAKIHRVYLCDDKSRPVNVISLCDVLDKFVKAPDGSCTIL